MTGKCMGPMTQARKQGSNENVGSHGHWTQSTVRICSTVNYLANM